MRRYDYNAEPTFIRLPAIVNSHETLCRFPFPVSTHVPCVP